MTTPELPFEDDHKLGELLVFISGRSEGDQYFGATKLNKLLFYCDFLAFGTLGKAITGHRYLKLKNGPAPRALVRIRRHLQKTKAIALGHHTFFGMRQIRVHALREAQLERFSAEEIALVTKVIDACKNKSAREMSDHSHRFPGWKWAEMNADIPYETALAKLCAPTDGELQLAKNYEQLATECLGRK